MATTAMVLGAGSIRENSFETSESESDVAFVYFHFETGGFSYDDEILQIAMKSGESSYTSYVTPTKPINPRASNVNGLTKNGAELLFRGKPVPTQPKGIVVREMLQFLKNLNKPCILIGHNVKAFHIPRLIELIIHEELVADFSDAIRGCCDTYSILCQKFLKRKRRPGYLKLATLVNEFLNIPFPNEHSAYEDVLMLEKLAVPLNFTNDKLITNSFNFSAAVSAKKNEKSLAPLQEQKILSLHMIKKIAKAGIDLNTLRQIFTEHGEEELVKFLEHGEFPKDNQRKKGNFVRAKEIKLIIDYLKVSCKHASI